MDAETRSALLTLAKAIVSLSEEAAAEVVGQYANGEVTTGVRFPMEGELSDLIDRLQAADAPALPPSGGRSGMDEPEMVTVDRRELLRLLDHVESLARFCSVSMPDVARYDAGSKALWAIVWRLKGDDKTADRLAAEVPERVVR